MTRLPGTQPTFRPYHRAAMLAVCLALFTILGPPLAVAQATWQVESLIPDVISIRVPTTTIAFQPQQQVYPPEQFPARYSATLPEGGVLPVQVFSNAEGIWNLILEVPALLNESGTGSIPASQVLYRVNDGIWVRADGNPQIIFTHPGPTLGWMEIRIEFALELQGNELAGEYVINAGISAAQEPAF